MSEQWGPSDDDKSDEQYVATQTYDADDIQADAEADVEADAEQAADTPDEPVADIEGTIVPAYVFNTLLGNLPLVGRLFSPEAGGGVFAATYRIQGALSDPAVTVNPLAALTPGFLRGLFGLFEGRGEEARRGGAPAEPAWDGRGPPPR